jgi:hypothetical protein
MQYVKTEDGNIKVGENGNPLVQEEGKEPYELDAFHLKSKVNELNEEAKKHRLSAKELQEKLDKFEGIDDPKKAKEALQTVQNLEDQKLIDAGKAEEMKKQIQDQYESKLSEKDQALSERDQQIHKLVVSNAFANSQVVNEKTILPPDVAEAYFGKNFTVENGQAVAYDQNGNPIHSREKPGEPAPFDEALDYLVENHPQRDRLIKGNPGGSGSPPGGGSPGGGGEAMSRQDFIKEQLNS